MRNARAILIEIGFCLEKKENKKKRKKRKKEFVFRENEMSSPPARWKTDKHSWFIRGTTEPNRSETVRSSIRSSLFSLAIRRDAVRLRGYIRFCASPLLFNFSPYSLSLSLPLPNIPDFSPPTFFSFHLRRFVRKCIHVYNVGNIACAHVWYYVWAAFKTKKGKKKREEEGKEGRKKERKREVDGWKWEERRARKEKGRERGEKNAWRLSSCIPI